MIELQRVTGTRLCEVISMRTSPPADPTGFTRLKDSLPSETCGIQCPAISLYRGVIFLIPLHSISEYGTTNRDPTRAPFPSPDVCTIFVAHEYHFMPKISAGLLMYRIQSSHVQVLLVHPGGPFFRNKDEGAWTIPKGEADEGEDLLTTAQREFVEETGLSSAGPFIALAPVKQKSGKSVHAWAFGGNCDPENLVSNKFTPEWPPKSGKQTEFPEVDQAEWFDLPTAKRKINPAQAKLIEE